MTCVPVSLVRKYTWDSLQPSIDACALTVLACEHRFDALALTSNLCETHCAAPSLLASECIFFSLLPRYKSPRSDWSDRQEGTCVRLWLTPEQTFFARDWRRDVKVNPHRYNSPSVWQLRSRVRDGVDSSLGGNVGAPCHLTAWASPRIDLLFLARLRTPTSVPEEEPGAQAVAFVCLERRFV